MHTWEFTYVCRKLTKMTYSAVVPGMYVTALLVLL